MKEILERAQSKVPEQDSAGLKDETLRTIALIDVAGLSRPNGRNWYPVDADDLLTACAKVEATREDVEALLDRCGFFPLGTAPMRR